MVVLSLACSLCHPGSAALCPTVRVHAHAALMNNAESAGQQLLTFGLLSTRQSARVCQEQQWVSRTRPCFLGSTSLPRCDPHPPAPVTWESHLDVVELTVTQPKSANAGSFCLPMSALIQKAVSAGFVFKPPQVSIKKTNRTSSCSTGPRIL